MDKEHLIKYGHFSLWSSTLGISLYFCALITSMLLVGTEPVIQIKRPWVLLTVFIAGVFPIRHQSFSLLQRLLLVYFVCMLISQLTMDQIILASQSYRFILPKSVIPLFLYAMGFILYVISGQMNHLLKRNAHWWRLWGIVSAILIVHMICLWGLLKSIYGFGYEHNIEVLGKLLLYALCFLFTWDILNQSMVRYLSLGCIIAQLLLIVL